MQKNRNSLTDIGILLALGGLAVYAALWLGRILYPFAGLAILVGVVLLLIGLATPGKRR